MKWKIPLLMIVVAVSVGVLPALATIINIPDDYPAIQQGIDASTDGDTVLVQPGTYVENIFFNGHNIVLGSLFLTTGDTTCIAETIIDGSSGGEVVYFGHGENNEAELTGFTIRNGYGFWRAGGIYCNNSNPVISNNHVMDNIAAEYGAGILCDNNSNPSITGNRIMRNSARFDGAGIECKANSNALIMNNIIVENTAWRNGGGIYCQDSDPIIINNVISNNRAGFSGGGIYCELVSNPVIVNTIFWADSAQYSDEIENDDSSSPYFIYCDIQGGWDGEGNIHFYPLFRDPENGDFHLASFVCGDDYDSPCIDAGDPAIIDSLLDCSWGLGELRSDMGAYGGGDSAILDEEWVVCDVGSVHNYITNSTFTRGSGSNEWTILIGDDINEYPSMIWTVPPDYAEINHYLYYAALRIGYDRTLAHLSTDTSPGIQISEPPSSISDFDTHFHISTREEDSISIRVHENTYAWAAPEADDFIIYDFWIVNTDVSPLESLYVAFFADCDVSAAGGGSGSEGYWRDDLAGYYRDYDSGEFISYMYDGDSPYIDGDDEGGRYEPKESLGYLGSRLLYCPPIVGDSVPSVQQGHSWWEWESDPGYDSIWFDYMSDDIWMDPPENPEDMRYLQKTGPFEVHPSDSINIVFAFGIGEGEDGLRANLEIAQQYFDNGYIPTSVDSDIPVIPASIGLQNYPNPFNSSTVIRYNLPEQSDVRIEIFNILGQRVATLFEGFEQPGPHSIAWRAGNCRSGIYFARLEAANRIENIKMVLLK